MENPRETLISAFADGKNPTGSHFRLLIESILSRHDDGIEKTIDTPLKVLAGKDAHAPVLALCPKGVLDPQWIISLKALDGTGAVIGEGLNIGQGDNPTAPMVFIEKSTGNVGLGSNQPQGALEVKKAVNGVLGVVVNNASDGAAAHALLRLRTAGGDGVIFKNANVRTADGGIHAMTVRNDAGDLRLQSKGSLGLMVKADNGRVGINNENPAMPLDVNGGMTLNGNSLYFPSLNAGVSSLGPVGLYWQGAGLGADIGRHGIYRTDGAWTTGVFQQLRMQFDTGIQLGAGTGVGTGSAKSYVDVVNGKGLMVSSGNLGVGTVTPAAKAQVVTTAFDGEQALPATWNASHFVVGGDNAVGGVGIGYHPANNIGYLIAASPGGGYKDLSIKARTTILHNGTNESMRIMPDGRIGIGITAPEALLHLKRDGNTGTLSTLANLSAGADAYVAARFQNDAGSGWIFKNSSVRAIDGGVNTMTVRNDVGDLRLQAQGQLGFSVKATTGNIAIGTAAGDHFVHARRDTNAVVAHVMRNASGAALAQVAYWLQNDLTTASMYKTSSTSSDAAGAHALVLTNDGGALRLQTQGFVGMHINGADGFVGIGNASPRGRLDLAGGAMLINCGYAYPAARPAVTKTPIAGEINGYSTNGPGSDDGFLRLSAGGGSSGAKSYIDLFGWANTNEQHYSLVLGTAGQERMRIDGNGNIGMGTTVMDAALHVKRNLNAGVTTLVHNQSAGAAAYTQYLLRTDNSVGTIFKNSSQRLDDGGANTMTVRNDFGDMRLQAQGSLGLQIKATSGYVGINTTNPYGCLHVNGGTLSLAASEDAGRRNNGGHAQLGALSFYGHARNADNDSARIVCGSTGWDDSGFLAFHTSDGALMAVERLRIDLDGKVGIGTPTPKAALHIASTGKVVDGKGLLLGKLNDPIRSSATPGEVLGMIDIGFAGYRDSTPNHIGAKISAVRIANYPAPNSHFIQATELAFFTGDGGTGPAKNDVFEVCAERMRINKDGKVGIGTANPHGRLDVVGGPIMLNGGLTNGSPRPAMSAIRMAGEINAYSAGVVGGDDGFMRLSAGGGSSWSVKSYIDFSGYSTIPDMDRNLVFGTSGVERMRIDINGNLGLGSTPPENFVHYRRDVDGNVHNITHNNSNGANAYTLLGIRTDNSYGFIFKNSSTRSGDGGVNTMTLRNDLGDLRLQAQGGVGMHVKASNGFVGINTSSPFTPLHVNGGTISLAASEDAGRRNIGGHPLLGSLSFYGHNRGAENDSARIVCGSTGGDDAGFLAFCTSTDSLASVERVRIDASGKVGIGTTNPSYPLHIPIGIAGNIPPYGYLNPGGAGTYGSVVAAVSIWTGGRIVAAEFNSISDARTKENVKISDTSEDLALLQQIDINNYTFRDVVGKGSQRRKGVIAQQIKTFLPEAVATHADVVPDIYAAPTKVALEEGKLMLTMEKPHGLKTGDEVRIYSKTGFAQKPVKVKNKHAFSLNEWEYDTEGMFVYGRLVDDFMVVDYNYLFTVGLSATQELHRQVEELKAQNALLLQEVAAIQNALAKLNIN